MKKNEKRRKKKWEKNTEMLSSIRKKWYRGFQSQNNPLLGDQVVKFFKVCVKITILRRPKKPKNVIFSLSYYEGHT